MTKPNEWLTLLANVAVVVGIGLLVYEIRQNEQVLKDDTQLSLLALLHERDAWILDPEFAAVVARAETPGADLGEVEFRQFTDWLSGKWNACEYIFERYGHEVASDSYWIGWKNGCVALLDSATARRAWAERREWYGTRFRAFYDEYAAGFEDG